MTRDQATHTEEGCEHCEDQLLAPLPDDWADDFVLSYGAIWYCGEGVSRGRDIKYCPWCGRELKEKET